MSKIGVRIEPEKSEDNEYATPCFFFFDDIEEAIPIIRMAMKYGDGVDVHLSKYEN